MALLDMCCKQHTNLLVCHVNYHWRKTSDNDENLVVDYCQKNHVPYELLEIDPAIYQSKRFNFENWARQIRYHFFCLMGQKYHSHKILVAHTLDDWLETALMQKNKHVRTTYYGIRESNQFDNLLIERPLITWHKKDIYKYCKAHRISYAIDQTNFDTTYQRNKIRHQLSKYNDSQINQLINDFQQLNKKLKQTDLLAKKTYRQWKLNNWNLTYFKKQSSDIQIEMVYQLLIEFSPQRMSLNKINGIVEFINSGNSHKKFRINQNLSLINSHQSLKFIK